MSDFLECKQMIELWYVGFMFDESDEIEVRVGYDIRDVESMKTLIDHHCRGTNKPYGFRRFLYNKDKKEYLDKGTMFIGGKKHSFREIESLADKDKSNDTYSTVLDNMKSRHVDYVVLGRDKRWHDFDESVDQIV